MDLFRIGGAGLVTALGCPLWFEASVYPRLDDFRKLSVSNLTDHRVEGSFNPIGLTLGVDVEPADNGCRYTVTATKTVRDDLCAILKARLAMTGDNIKWSYGITPAKQDLGANRHGSDDLLPLIAATDGWHGTAMYLPPDLPVMYKVGFDGGPYVQWEVALSDATHKFPGMTRMQLYIVSVAADRCYRAALADYYGRFPAHFVRRINRNGPWWFSGVVKREDFADYYVFSEVADDPGPKPVGEDGNEAIIATATSERARGMMEFRYVNPGQCELMFLEQFPERIEIDDRNPDANLHFESNPEQGHNILSAAAIDRVLAEHPVAGPRLPLDAHSDTTINEIIRNSGIYHETGVYETWCRVTPWAGNSITFPINADPELPAAPGRSNAGQRIERFVEEYVKHYPVFSGLYIDSIFGFGRFLNYRREHFACADAPLTFDEAGRACLPNQWGMLKLLQRLRAGCDKSGHFLFGNARWALRCGFFIQTLCDLRGVETGLAAWSSEELAYYRCQCHQKQVLSLLSSSEPVTPQQLEAYLKVCLIYKVYPAPCWPEMPVTDRPAVEGVYVKYLQLLQKLEAAGDWQILSDFRCANHAVICEQYGPARGGMLVLLNPSSEKQLVRVLSRTGSGGPAGVINLMNQAAYDWRGGGLDLPLQAGELMLLRLAT